MGSCKYDSQEQEQAVDWAAMTGGWLPLGFDWLEPWAFAAPRPPDARVPGSTCLSCPATSRDSTRLDVGRRRCWKVAGSELMERRNGGAARKMAEQ